MLVRYCNCVLFTPGDVLLMGSLSLWLVLTQCLSAPDLTLHVCVSVPRASCKQPGASCKQSGFTMKMPRGRSLSTRGHWMAQ